MASLRLLLYGGLIFITAIAFPVDKNTTKSSIVFDYVVPMHYDIKLIIYFKGEDRIYFKDEERVYFKEMERDDIYRKFKTVIEKHQAKGRFIFYGELNVTIDIFHPTTKISLNSSSSIYYLSGELIENNANNVKHSVANFSYNDETQICDLYFEVDEVPRGNYILNIKFLNAINTAEDDTIFLKTIYIKKLKSKTWSDTTDFQIEAQRFFPCWDKPTIRTTFNISIKHHRSFKALSNMPIRQVEIITDFQLLHPVETYFHDFTHFRTLWTHFETTPAMNAHLVMVVLTPLFRSSGTNRIHMWRIPYCAKHIKFAQGIANKVMMKLKYEWFKELEIPELQLVTISDLQNDTNMNFGLVTIRETNIIYDKNVHSLAQKIEVARLIARGVAYQWFGNLISPSWSSYSWLNDGLTTLFGMDALDAVNALEDYENSGMMDLFIVQQYESLNSYEWFLTELLSEASSPSEINLFSSFFRYIKAPLILRMLQHLVTKEVFWRGIRRYLHMHALNSTTPNDFWTVMQAAVDESYPENVKREFSLEMLIYCWRNYTHYPVLKIIRNYNACTIIIENYKAFKNCSFSIPITFTTENNLNFMNLASPLHDERLILIQTYKLFDQIDIIEDGWIIFNIQQSGHYRVNYDVENWRKIADYLNSGKYKKIHVLNRAKIIDDAFYFMMGGKEELDSSIFWNLTSYLEQETNYVAWYPMIKALEYISGFFPFSDEKFEYIKKKLNNTLGSLLSKIKYEETFEEEEFTKCLRQEAIKWACILGNSDCQEWVKITLQRKLSHIEKLETDKLLSWWDEWIYCKGLMLADSKTWHTMKNMTLVHNNDNRFLEFLACSQNNIDEYLKLITPEDNGTYMGIQANKSVNSFLFIIAKQTRNNNVFRNILINFNKLKPRDVSMMAAFAIIINHVYSKDQLNEIRNFTKEIIEREAFSEHAYQKNTHEPNYEEREYNFRKYKSQVEQWLFEVESKLKNRLDEIDKYIDYFHTYLT